jgi:hypothetical protein
MHSLITTSAAPSRRLTTTIAAALVGLAILLGSALSPAPAHAGQYDYLLPPAGTCGSAENGDMSKSYYEWTVAGMCLIDHVRANAGLARLNWPYKLQGSSYNKAADIAVCQPDLNAYVTKPDGTRIKAVHRACGRDENYWFNYFGYPNGCSRAGWAENVYVGPGTASTARAAVLWWVNSTEGHREALLNPEWTGGVLSYSGPGTYRGTPDTRVWVYHMGYCR